MKPILATSLAVAPLAGPAAARATPASSRTIAVARRTRHTLLWYWKLWFLLAFCGWHGLLWAAAPSSASESAVKAAYLHRIAGLVEWPRGSFQGPDAPLVIAVAGNDAVASDLEQLSTGRPVNGRQVAVRRLRDGDPLEGAHVLLVGAGREARVRELASAAGPLLVVTEQEAGHQLGSVLNFVVVDGRVRFTASLPQADARGLRLSARLLEVAHAVEGRSR